MKRLHLVHLLGICGGILLCLYTTACFMRSNAAPQEVASGGIPDVVDYNYHVKPILSDKCFKCHGPDGNKRKADLRLDMPESAFAPSKDDPNIKAIVPNHPEKSELIKRIESTDPNYLMPSPDSHLELTDQEKAILKKWILQGAKYKKHWAFILPTKPHLPVTKHTDWVKNEIDAFVAAKLDEKGLSPSPEADRQHLIRRVSFDLIGLPPSLAMMDKYEQDTSANWYEKLVDELLAKPAYGERWAAPWLDLARYADTHGLHENRARIMWPWRDWVIHAFNQNMPYDQFLTWQLAGDLVPNANKESILATGFIRNHPMTEEGGIIEEEFMTEYAINRTGTFGKAVLGLTFECARCHDHKYDPITQKEFYEVMDFFNHVPEIGKMEIGANIPNEPIYNPPLLKITEEDLKTTLNFLTASAKDVKVMVMRDSSKQNVPYRKTYLLNRGLYDQPQEEVHANTPSSLLTFPADLQKNRLGLAQWALSPQNTLTSRVAVNRMWQELFGTGIVPSSDNVGNQGELPTHPELLDWLAVTFRENGWNMKALLKKIVMSATYRQSSITSSEAREIDPQNKWLSHYPRRRMAGEMIRDNVLASSGLLSPKMGGPGVNTYTQGSELWAQNSVGYMTFEMSKGEDLYRRTLYTFWNRMNPHPSMLAFDMVSREVCTIRRPKTNTPLQSLALMNDEQIMEASRVLAAKTIIQGKSEQENIWNLFRKIVHRSPSREEQSMLSDLLAEQRSGFQQHPKNATKLIDAGQFPQEPRADKIETAAYTILINALYNLDETISVF
jgi:hypothetical protein